MKITFSQNTPLCRLRRNGLAYFPPIDDATRAAVVVVAAAVAAGGVEDDNSSDENSFCMINKRTSVTGVKTFVQSTSIVLCPAKKIRNFHNSIFITHSNCSIYFLEKLVRSEQVHLDHNAIK